MAPALVRRRRARAGARWTAYSIMIAGTVAQGVASDGACSAELCETDSLALIQRRATVAGRGDGGPSAEAIIEHEEEHQCEYEDVEYFRDVGEAERRNVNANPIVTDIEKFGRPGPLQKIYYVNLPEEVNRRHWMETRLNKSGVPWERFEAYTAADVEAGKYDYIQQGRPLCKSKQNSSDWSGILANLFGHIAIYEKILADDPGGNGTYLVMEDDAYFPDNWTQTLEERLQEVPEDWTVVACGNWGKARCKDVLVGNQTNGVALATHPMATPEVISGEDTCVAEGGDLGDAVDHCWYGGTTAQLVSPLTIPRLLGQLYHQLPCSTDMSHLSAGDSLTYSLQPPIFPGLQINGSTIREESPHQEDKEGMKAAMSLKRH